MQEVIAKARYVRMSPRKIRLVIDAVRGKNVASARAQLRFMKKAAAFPVLTLLDSAVANAQHNFKLDPAALVIQKITADGGPVLHRWRARAMGRAAPIRKRTTHITIVLGEQGATAAKSDKAEAPAASEKKSVKKAAPKAKKAVSAKGGKAKKTETAK